MTTMNTPHKEIAETIWKEWQACGYWVGKKLNSKSFMHEIGNKLRSGEQPNFNVEYKAKSGNRWINYCFPIRVPGYGISTHFDSYCYWETYGSFGTFIPMFLNGEICTIMSSGHFWQRVCERADYKMQGVHTAIKFFSEHLIMKQVILPPLKEDKRRRCALHWYGGAGYGYEIAPEYNLFEIRTYIPESMMTKKQLKDHLDALDSLPTEEDKKQWYKDMAAYVAGAGPLPEGTTRNLDMMR